METNKRTNEHKTKTKTKTKSPLAHRLLTKILLSIYLVGQRSWRAYTYAHTPLSCCETRETMAAKTNSNRLAVGMK